MKNKTQLHPLAAGIQSALAGGAFLMLATTGFSAMAQDATAEKKAEDAAVEKRVDAILEKYGY